MAGRRVDRSPTMFAVHHGSTRHGVAILPTWCAAASWRSSKAEGLFERAVQHGEIICAPGLTPDFPAVVLDRGRGLVCAFSLPTTADRDELIIAGQRHCGDCVARPVQTPCDSVHR